MKKTAIALVCCSLLAAPVFADVFTITIDVTTGGQSSSETFGFSDVSSIFDQLDEQQLEQSFPNYDENASTAFAAVDYRGLPMTFAYPDMNSTRLVFEVPSLGIHEEFNGATRDVSADQLQAYLESEGGAILNRIQKALIATSPVDPIAGNPGSLMGTMVADQFDAGFTAQTSNIQRRAVRTATTQAQNVERQNLLAIGARFGRYSADGKQSDVLNLPLGYSINLDGDGALRQVNLSLPITVLDTEGAKTASVALGAGFTFAVNERWSLTPAFSVGVVGSSDLGSAGGIGSTSLTSAYRIDRDGYILNVGNMLGYFQTLSFEYGDYNFDPDVSNTVARNGLMVSVPKSWHNRDIAVEYWITDTRFFGDELYSEYYDEVGVSIGLAKTEEFSLDNYIRLGLSYLWGDGVDGFKVNFGYLF